jgi:hypothetical protein
MEYDAVMIIGVDVSSNASNIGYMKLLSNKMIISWSAVKRDTFICQSSS